MSQMEINKIYSSLKNGNKDLIIKISPNKISSSIEKTRLILEQIERAMRIQNMELQLKKMNIQRSWI